MCFFKNQVKRICPFESSFNKIKKLIIIQIMWQGSIRDVCWQSRHSKISSIWTSFIKISSEVLINQNVFTRSFINVLHITRDEFSVVSFGSGISHKPIQLGNDLFHSFKIVTVDFYAKFQPFNQNKEYVSIVVFTDITFRHWKTADPREEGREYFY